MTHPARPEPPAGSRIIEKSPVTRCGRIRGQRPMEEEGLVALRLGMSFVASSLNGMHICHQPTSIHLLYTRIQLSDLNLF
jgi:hypothetical protein